MDGRSTQDVANELYARGWTETREEALALVTENPDGVRVLLGLANADREMRHPDDRAQIDGPDGWGHADTGQDAA